jgi:4-hydroxy-2-oxoheptanedioate aldolase
MIRTKEKLARGETVRYMALGRVLHHNVINMIGFNGGFDGLWLDHEHVGFSMENLEIACTAARSQNLDCFVRIAPTDYALVTKCLEAGAGGIMAAMIYSAEQAEQIVRWAKFAPRGNRGLNVSGFDGRYTLTPVAKFVQEANQNGFVAIQIETLESVECVDAIAAIDGVDLLFVGPSDLSQALGVTGDFMHPKCQEAIDKVAAACRKHNKPWGAVTPNPEHCQMLHSKGCRMLSVSNDSRVVQAGLNAVKTNFAKFFET